MKYGLDTPRGRIKAMAGLLVIIAMMAMQEARAQDDTAVRALEQHVEQLEAQMKAIQNELMRVKSHSAREAQKVTEVEEMARTIDRRGSEDHKHMLFFRGGFAHSMQNRNGVTLQSNVAPVGAQDQADKDAWYIGAGFDFSLTNDLWGIMPKTDVMAELMFEYKRFGVAQGNALANAPTQLAGGGLNPRAVTVSQFTLTAAPKIKFLDGYKLRPWIIPAGLALHVISPPSESITVLTPGVMFAAGADYNIWKDFYVGVDARYHVTGGKHDGVNIDGLTAGGYIGIGF
ncbi:hypothetical protein SAMN05216419_101523 [Nitrosomonas cryotolerans]|uniref:Outer membrane protein beta-barrel domain-containing protein n=1 Tax=Nitrosomonas cryotolerans ATCC 49181 TaxID=1131553 RepID=A0A1N6H4Z5_9PROT|nr:hypothetical protein [Nitrosomonas cryotolerans]SFP72009.1 hypothetical protein SAMN05216419_101523 [Nitrosomonas cryotolerans]SIO14737.1 hypothetical protein SAMN02743940_1018 [Nitrosomonas cryotolerans ATCC 49181]